MRQLRLRDVGGIIVIDFIHMANPKNRQQVEDALRLELQRDRTKTYVVEISPLGLVEMTRQNVTDGPREVMTRRRPTCDGDGIVVSEGTTAVEIERRLARPRHARVAGQGVQGRAQRAKLDALLARPGRWAARARGGDQAALLLRPGGGRPSAHFRVLGQGSVENQEPAAPVAVGDEIELKLGEVGLHDPRAGVGKVKGFEVVVADAGRLVGKKVKVRVAAVMEGVAYGVLVQAATSEDGPITAEAEAERPTRARRPARRTEVESIEGPDAAVDDPGAGEDGDGEAEAPEAPRTTRRSPPRPARRSGVGPPSAGRRRPRLPPTRTRPRATTPASTSPREPRGGRRGRAAGAEEANAPRHSWRPEPQAQAHGGGCGKRGPRGRG